jgi:hypothetical protein
VTTVKLLSATFCRACALVQPPLTARLSHGETKDVDEMEVILSHFNAKTLKNKQLSKQNK